MRGGASPHGVGYEHGVELETLGPHWEDNFWRIFGIKLDGGKGWRRRLPGALEGGTSMVLRGGACVGVFFLRLAKAASGS